MIRICGPRDRAPEGARVFNVTSRSKLGWTKEFSPFFLGPCALYDGQVSQNMENAWQYSKVYPAYADEKGDPTPTYFAWAQAGWYKQRADRYPMGKGGPKPLYSWWDGKKLDYVSARKAIYIPLYARAVREHAASSFQQLHDLVHLCDDPSDIWLWDFDGYDHVKAGMSLQEVADCPSRKMGHCFVLAMMLTNVCTDLTS